MARWYAKTLLIALPVAACAAATSLGQEQPPPALPAQQAHDFFESKVRPLLINRCGDCHGADAQEAELRLDVPDSILRGGKSGSVVVAGQPAESLLIQAVKRTSDSLQMPPDEKLPADEIAILEQWVQSGAAVPGDTGAKVRPAGNLDLEKERQYWAFVPPTESPLPAVKNSAWVKSPIDQFILAKLEGSGIQPAAPADKRTLIRRATFDLIGLPPTPEEVDAFLRDESPDAFAKVVERLLASPRYGERWGRHWLDVVRYADSNGLDENIAHGNAWRYRDYVIAAFNRDKPYDQFLLEQIAGDLLLTDDPQARNERLIATGFLTLGPKALAESDLVKLEMDLIDEQVDTVGRAILGLTIGCARCHDHKFDPILTADYYAMAGIFKSTRTMETFARIAKWHENPLRSAEYEQAKAQYEPILAAKRLAIQQIIDKAKQPLIAAASATGQSTEIMESQFPAEVQAELKKERDELAKLEAAGPVQPTAMGVSEAAVTDLAIHVRGDHQLLGAKAPRNIPVVLASNNPPAFPADESGRLQLAQWMVRTDHPLTSRVMVNRIWRWHFGQAICRTPDNFGQLGERPTHPELLDYLAVRFVRDGWSMKAMHRLLMLSSTYQMSSAYDAVAAEKDTENRLWWRMNVRRLEAEAIRDAILAASGTLDLLIGGSMLHVKNREFLFDHTSTDKTSYDSLRRSVYLPVIRNHLYDFYQLFDYTDASTPVGDRSTTTVAPQALFFANSDLVLKASEALAAKLLDDASMDDRQRLVRVYERAFGRPASDEEIAEGLAFTAAFAAGGSGDAAELRKRSWAALVQTVLSSNEFVYLK